MSMTLTVKPTLIDRVVPNSFAADIALVVGGAALTAIAAQIQFTIGNNPVPFTLQTLSVLLVASVLGSVRGSLSMLVYGLAGIIFPVYAQGAHGLNILFGATGGYLAGFIVAGFLVGKLAERNWSSNVLKMAASYIIGSAAVYALGVTVLTFSAFKGDWSLGLQYGLYPFLIWDAVKAIVAAGLVPGAWAVVKAFKGN